MKLTRSNRQLLRRLAAGDKLYTDTRRGSAVVHHDDCNHTGQRRVLFDTIRKLVGAGLIEVVDEFHKRGEYSIHWHGLTEAGRSEVIDDQVNGRRESAAQA